MKLLEWVILELLVMRLQLQERMREIGTEVTTPELMTSAGFGAFIRAEYERMREAAQMAGLKKE